MRIYTDASTRKQSGIAFIITDECDVEISRGVSYIEEPDNNTAELKAILYGLQGASHLSGGITVLSDSKYAVGVIKTGQCRPWEKETLDEIYKITSTRRCKFMWIKGHCNNGTILAYYNKQADNLAKKVRKSYSARKRIAKQIKNIRSFAYKQKTRE